MADGLNQLKAHRSRRQRSAPPPSANPKKKATTTEPVTAAAESNAAASSTPAADTIADGGGSPGGAATEVRAEGAGASPSPSAAAATPVEVEKEPEAESQGVSAGAVTNKADSDPSTLTEEQSADERGVESPPQQGSLQVVPHARTAPRTSVVLRSWDEHRPPPVPEGLPRAEDVLQQRYIDREPLNASVPRDLKFAQRLDWLKVVSRIDRIPPADLVAIGLDWFLRGAEPTLDAISPPWNQYTGGGTAEEIPQAEVVLQRRFITREPLKAQVPVELDLSHRLAMYRVMNGLTRVPPADVVSVALDRWLRLMRF